MQSPKLVHGRPARDETESDSWKSPSPLDSEEWDEPECGNWSCCLIPPVKEEGVTWEEITSEPLQRCIVMEQDDSDWDADDGTEAPEVSHSQGVSEQSLPRKETLMETLTEPLAEAPHNDMLAEAAMGPGSEDVVQLHAGDNDLE